jgi:hypothetical protein
MLAGISNVNGAQISRRCSTTGTGKSFMEGRLFPQDEMPSPLAIGVSMLILQSERRRIVALVRREALKNQDLFALQNSEARRDDLLTITVDKARRPGL